MKKSVSIIVVIVFGLMIFNIWVSRSLRDNLSEHRSPASLAPESAPALTAAPVVASASDVRISGPVNRRNQVIPGDDYEESVFYVGDKEIARQKIMAGVVVQQTGTIPDGKITVEDDYKGSRGEEYYKDGKKFGTARLYYENGTLRQEMVYAEGKVITKREFFNTGAIHIEEDFRDALDIPNEREVGIGKVYFSDGRTIRYEWNLTKTNKRGFKRAYNEDGQLIAESYFDSRGKMISPVKR